MDVKRSIFPSQSERANFYKLRRAWGDKYAIYQNIPFLNLFQIGKTEVEPRFFEYLKKTSIDYIVCDNNDTPIIALEFDGIQQGKSIGTKYSAEKGFDIWREKSFQQKLQIAERCKFPFLVVGDYEFRDISTEIKLTIVDGIIGCILAEKAFQREFHEQDFLSFIGYSAEEFEHLTRSERQQLGESFGIHVEVTTELENNPIDRAAWTLMAKLRDEIQTYGFGGLPVSDSNRFVGARFYIESKTHGLIERHVTIPAFRTSGLISVSTLARDIAQLLALVELQEKLNKSSTSDTLLPGLIPEE